MNKLELDKAAFAYPSDPERPVLEGLDARIPLRGGTLVLGGNGSGKTALARLLAGLDTPAAGALRWPDGDERADGAMRAAVVFEEPDFQFQGFSVAEELAGGLLYRGARRDEAERMAREGAGRLGLGELLDRELSSLDYPTKLYVLSAAFLLLEPLMMVLDFSLAELKGEHRQMLLSRCGGDGQPSLVVLSRRAVDLSLLDWTACFTLSGAGLHPFPYADSTPGDVENLRSAGLMFPWYAGREPAPNAAGWSWLAPPNK